MERLEDRIVTLISQQLRIEKTRLTPDMLFIEDLGIDSIDFVELVMCLESEFRVKIPNDQIRKTRSIQDIIDHLKLLVCS